MIDHRRAGRRAKRRGDRGELEVRDLVRYYGFDRAHRQFQSGGQGGGDLADAIPDVHLEVKFVEKLGLPATWRQCVAAARATDTIVIAHRCNMQPWLATLQLEEFVGLRPNRPVFRLIGGRESVRAEMFAFLREQSLGTAVVVHPIIGTRPRGTSLYVGVPAATLLLTELLELLRREHELGLAG